MFWDHLNWKRRARRYRRKQNPGEIGYILDHVQPGDWVVDIGAHKGAFSYWFLEAVGPKGRVFAFEPQPLLAARLAKLAVSRGNLQVENAGVSSKAERRELFLPDKETSAAASLEKLAGRDDRSLQVETKTLDEYFARRTMPISLMKIDVEGHEMQVFQGAVQLLKQDRPALIFECEQRHLTKTTIHDVFHYLEELGYGGSFFQGTRRRPLSEMTEAMTVHGSPDYVNNFLFIPNQEP